MSAKPKPYNIYYRITASLEGGATTVTNASGLVDNKEYVTISFPKPKQRLSQRLMSAARHLWPFKNAPHKNANSRSKSNE